MNASKQLRTQGSAFAWQRSRVQVSSGPPLVPCKQLEKDKSFLGVREVPCGNRTSKRFARCILTTPAPKASPVAPHGGVLGPPDVGHIERLAASTAAARCEAPQGEQETPKACRQAYRRPPQRCFCLVDHGLVYAHNSRVQPRVGVARSVSRRADSNHRDARTPPFWRPDGR